MATIIRLDDPKYAAQVAALSAEYDREYKLNSGRDPPRDNEETFDQLLAKAKALAQGDTVKGARLIEGAAWLTGVDALQKALFLDTVKGRLKSGVKIEALRDLWAIAAAKAAQDRGPTPEEAAWERKEQARITAEEKALEAAVLFKGAKSLAMVEDIVADAVSTAQLAGVVGEASAVSAHYLAMTSRVLHESRVLSTLGTGQSSLGKSYVAEKVEIMMPPECVIPITSGSPKSLVYMVVDDPAALKHRIVIVHEAAGFIAGNDVEANPSAAIVREIMTRGRANYPYVERNDDGQLTTKMLIAEGPIALVTTSARDNLDPEMLNRLVAIPGNESPKATRDIQIAQVTGAAEKTKAAARPRILAHRALQEWLQAEGAGQDGDPRRSAPGGVRGARQAAGHGQDAARRAGVPARGQGVGGLAQGAAAGGQRRRGHSDACGLQDRPPRVRLFPGARLFEQAEARGADRAGGDRKADCGRSGRSRGAGEEVDKSEADFSVRAYPGDGTKGAYQLRPDRGRTEHEEQEDTCQTGEGAEAGRRDRAGKPQVRSAGEVGAPAVVSTGEPGATQVLHAGAGGDRGSPERPGQARGGDRESCRRREENVELGAGGKPRPRRRSGRS